jgi:hypothetical protein
LDLRLRNEAVREVIESERIYVTRLQFCIQVGPLWFDSSLFDVNLQHFLQPLEDAISIGKPILKEEEIQKIFCHLGTLVHRKLRK